MMSCQKIHELQSEAHGGHLTWVQRLGLWLHVRLCPPCVKAERGLCRTLELLRELGGRQSAPPAREYGDSQKRVMQRHRQHRAA